MEAWRNVTPRAGCMVPDCFPCIAESPIFLPLSQVGRQDRATLGVHYDFFATHLRAVLLTSSLPFQHQVQPSPNGLAGLMNMMPPLFHGPRTVPAATKPPPQRAAPNSESRKREAAISPSLVRNQAPALPILAWEGVLWVKSGKTPCELGSSLLDLHAG